MSNIDCPICNNDCKYLTAHVFLKYDINFCESCNYSFVDCSKLTSLAIRSDQASGATTFGQNKLRNNFYLSKLQDLIKIFPISSILEIGTPPDFDFLNKIHMENPSISISSHDIFRLENLPEYINFYESLDEIKDNYFDLIFCIHTLEHIPTTKLLEFITHCQRISKYFIFEVPYCPTLDRILESSLRTPHYSFFTKDSILKLFKTFLSIEIEDKIIRFSNIKKN